MKLHLISICSGVGLSKRMPMNLFHIYALYQPKLLEEREFDFFSQLISKKKTKEISKFIHAEDAQRKLLSEVLARFVIVRSIGLKNADIKFETNSYRKPFIKGYKEFQFNLSHSGHWVVFAWGLNPIGVDIEQIRYILPDMKERFLTKEEQSYITSHPINKRVDAFYEIWTLKESLVKAIGKGLYIPLEEFAIIMNDKTHIQAKGNISNIQAYHFRQFEVDPGYKCAVCSEGKIHDLQLKIESIPSLFEKCQILI